VRSRRSTASRSPARHAEVAARVRELWAAGADRVELGTPQGRTTPTGIDLICERVLPLLRSG
jgi:5,10-methylenetetrahydromethanopterin reductase